MPTAYDILAAQERVQLEANITACKDRLFDAEYALAAFVPWAPRPELLVELPDVDGVLRLYYLGEPSGEPSEVLSARLLAIAVERGRSVHAVYNGTPMVAEPSDRHSTDVRKRWTEAREAGSLQHRLRRLSLCQTATDRH